MASKPTIRTRFAPSPTGPLHMGGVRTALFNYLYAKQQGGVFVLRIEDTDKERSKAEWEQDILDNLKWLGLEWNEFAKQSERTTVYRTYLEKLLQEGNAYYCFCTTEELEAQKQSQLSAGEAPHYTGTCRNLSKKEIAERHEQGRESVIRFIVEQKRILFRDIIRDEIEFDTKLMGDTVIAKDLETPLYNFSVVIDDYDMNITHVIRGEDHIPNTPKQILLQEVLGFPTPQYGHLPLLLGEDRTKLSKRHGDNSVTRFREQGYLPEAVINFLALLGWNPGGEKELFTKDELLKEFSIERIQKGGAIFNVSRLNWINGVYLRDLSLEKLTELCIPCLLNQEMISKESDTMYTIQKTGESISFTKLTEIISLYQDRITTLCDISLLADYFFENKLSYEKELLRWKAADDEKTKQGILKIEHIISEIPEDKWNKEILEKLLMPEAEKEENRGYLLWPLRAALTGKKASAGPFDVAHVLGKEKTLNRLIQAKQKLESQ